MPVSIHVRGPAVDSDRVGDAVGDAYDELRRADAIFSTYRRDSQISRLHSGELDLTDALREVHDVRELCDEARARTSGWFDADKWSGQFDPTGLVKGWAIARADEALEVLDDHDTAINAGGDVCARVSDGQARPWRIGIEDPWNARRMMATVDLLRGAVATSGMAARGAHIMNPFTGDAVTRVLSATIVGPSILWADVWATATVAAGRSVVDPDPSRSGLSGLVAYADGRVQRWGVAFASMSAPADQTID